MIFFIAIALVPLGLKVESAPAWVQATQNIAAHELSGIPELSHPVLSAAATPQAPDAAPASAPAADPVHMAALVAAEDLRLRTLLHHVSRLTYPIVMAVPAGRPTLVLPGPASYTLADLQSTGAVLPLQDGSGYELVDSVLVATGASLKLGGGGLRTLLLDSSPSGFTSLVTWGGTLVLAGDSAQAPLKIAGWDGAANKPAADGVYGRPYIRAVGGRLDLMNVRASSLGFWSGRTGGVAWTGISSKVATGSAVSSSFIGNTYGAFVSRAEQVKFTDDLFEGNEIDGLRLHRGAMHATVTASAASRNGGNGFVVSRGAVGDVLKGDFAIHNGGNGFLLDGQSLNSGVSSRGRQGAVTVGTIVQSSEARDNLRAGILVDGGAGTDITNNIVCGAVTGIAVRLGASDTWISGNDIRCGGRIALEIGPAVTGTTVLNNKLTDARIGLLIRNSPGVRIIGNRFSGISLFGISVRGASPGVVGSDNFIAGRGFQPIDTRSGANPPEITTTDTSAWQHRSTVSLASYLRYHPIMTTWFIILLLVAVAAISVRFRRTAPRPYTYTMGWMPAAQRDVDHAAPLAKAATQPLPASAQAGAPPAVLWRPFAKFARPAGADATTEPDKPADPPAAAAITVSGS